MSCGPLADHDAVPPSGLSLVKSFVGGAKDLAGSESVLGKGSDPSRHGDATERSAVMPYLQAAGRLTKLLGAQPSSLGSRGREDERELFPAVSAGDVFTA